MGCGASTATAAEPSPATGPKPAAYPDHNNNNKPENKSDNNAAAAAAAHDGDSNKHAHAAKPESPAAVAPNSAASATEAKSEPASSKNNTSTANNTDVAAAAVAANSDSADADALFPFNAKRSSAAPAVTASTTVPSTSSATATVSTATARFTDYRASLAANSVTELDLSKFNVRALAFRDQPPVRFSSGDLAVALSQNTSLRSLTLQGNKISHETDDDRALLTQLGRSALEELDLGSNAIGDKGAELLFATGAGGSGNKLLSTVTTLRLPNNAVRLHFNFSTKRHHNEQNCYHLAFFFW